MKIDIGCGGRGTMYDDFVGIDIHPTPENPRSKGKHLQLDFLKDELPFKEVDFAICLHTIEHLMPDDAIKMIKKVMKVLKPGAEFIISCPDLELFCRKYLEKDGGFWESMQLHCKGDTIADKFNYYMHQNSHVWQYDSYSLMCLAGKAGVQNVMHLPKEHEWCKRPDHEIGIIIKK